VNELGLGSPEHCGFFRNQIFFLWGSVNELGLGSPEDCGFSGIKYFLSFVSFVFIFVIVHILSF